MEKYASQRQSGFTLVELLIVVIILSILAAIVVPQFASSSDDAKISALDSSLSNMRSAIDLYYQQHGKYPSAATAAGGTCPGGGTAGTGAINTEQAFVDQMTRYTNSAGQSCTTKDAVFKYGPYLKKDALPTNPVSGVSILAVSTTGALGMTGAAVAAGWKFDNITGQFIADDAAYDDH